MATGRLMNSMKWATWFVYGKESRSPHFRANLLKCRTDWLSACHTYRHLITYRVHSKSRRRRSATLSPIATAMDHILQATCITQHVSNCNSLRNSISVRHALAGFRCHLQLWPLFVVNTTEVPRSRGPEIPRASRDLITTHRFVRRRPFCFVSFFHHSISTERRFRYYCILLLLHELPPIQRK